MVNLFSQFVVAMIDYYIHHTSTQTSMPQSRSERSQGVFTELHD